MVAPHLHTEAEAKAAIKRIEHNMSGPGSPAGKNAGPPSGIAGGSAGNAIASDLNKGPKGHDWIGGNQEGGAKHPNA